MTRLTVAVRVRPLSDREIAAKSVSIVSVENGKTVAVTNIKVPEQNAGDSRERVRRFTFDYCFGADSTQHDVYQNVGKEVAKAIKRRFHSCILAYGQSSSGKTHTMIGDADDAGLAPRLCQNIFDCLRETATGSEAENLNATVSYLEIYNEKVRDLLEPAGGLDQGISLKVREHPKKGPYVQGLSEKRVLDTEELLSYLSVGNSNRTIASTNANRRSSRSHSVFTVTCTGGFKLRLVDLAGSERAGSRSHTTSRFREGANINKSLVALRNVISALADSSRPIRQSRKRFIPYRDSILTWLLKDTLGGNSKTILISTVSPSSTCYNETVNTLRFGQRAKQIIVQPLVNEDPKERTIRELRAEIAKLRELLALTHAPVIVKKECTASLQNHPEEEWEEAEELDSGINSSTSFTSFEDDITSFSSSSIPSSPEDEYPCLNETKPDFFRNSKEYPSLDITKPEFFNCSKETTESSIFGSTSGLGEKESVILEKIKPQIFLNCKETEESRGFQITSSFEKEAESPVLVVSKPQILNKCIEVTEINNFEKPHVFNNCFELKEINKFQTPNIFGNCIDAEKVNYLQNSDYFEQNKILRFNNARAQIFQNCKEEAEINLFPVSSSFEEALQLELKSTKLQIFKECVPIDSFPNSNSSEVDTASTVKSLIFKNGEEAAKEDLLLLNNTILRNCEEAKEKSLLLQNSILKNSDETTEEVTELSSILNNTISKDDSSLLNTISKNESSFLNNTISEIAEPLPAFNKISEDNSTENSSTIELIPLMEVTSDVTKPKPLRRTFSMDQKINANPQLYSSTENLIRKNPQLRKRSVDRSMNSLLPNKKPEAFLKNEVKSKIDSYRKPRSQIVAAVTSRLYSKVKKKEASTDTDDIDFKILPKELSICSNARMRLQELSKKALRATKRKSVDTQTELFPVLRVKEISTDVDDLRFVFDEVRDVEVETQAIDLIDSSTNCSLSSEYKSGVTLTRTCGTSMDEDERISLSFAKYFEDYLKPKYEILGTGSGNNPIFTSTVNINVNHNYNIENLSENNNSVSEDSLEEAPVNMCFPDLISNHNSLEQNALEHPKIIKDLRYASLQVLPDENSLTLTEDDFSIKSESYLPSTSFEENLMDNLDLVSLETLYAPEIYLNENPSDDYDIFYKLPPLTCKPKIIFDALNPPAKIQEATVLKSIMKQQETSSEDESSVLTDLPDSLNYYQEKKKVRFDEASTSTKSDGQMFEAMANFMKEVTTLMTNLTKVASQLDTKTLQEESYDLEFTINDVKGLNLPKPKNKIRRKRDKIKSRPAHFVCTETQTPQSQTQNDGLSQFALSQNNLQTQFSQSPNNLHTQTNQSQHNLHTQMSQSQNNSSSHFPQTQNDIHTQISQLQNKSSSHFPHTQNDFPTLSSCSHFMQNQNNLHSLNTSAYFIQNKNNLPTSTQFIQNQNKLPSLNNSQHFTNNPNFICTETQTQNDLLHLLEDEFPVNKYETLVENSCDRLEKLVQKIENSVSAVEDLHKFPQPFSVNQDWVYNRSAMDDSSLESNQAFSDYGSLPRRKRVSSCSPSGYLRQLTSMRRQIVESSREELLNEAQIDM